MKNKTILPRSTPAEMGVEPSAIRQLLRLFNEKHLGAHGIQILRHGHVIAEGWWKPFRPELPHMLYSLSKSFTSTAIGFAVQEGLLHLNDRLVSFFPEHLPSRPCENMELITLRDLLTMSSGHTAEPDIFGRSPQYALENWASYFLQSYVEHKPGNCFMYNTAATYMLSAVLKKVTGKTVEEYLTPRLFEPLGIESHFWEKSPEGASSGGVGLYLTTESISRFGLFLLHRGEYEGRQLLNPEWIDEATAKQVENYGEGDWGQGYGYQFWRCVPEGVYRGDGMHGQYCVVLPRQDMVIAINSGSADMAAELKVIWEVLLPAVHDAPLPADPSEQSALEEALAALAFPLPEGEKSSETTSRISGQTWTLSPNWLGLDSVRLDFTEKDSHLVIGTNGREASLPVGLGEWKEGESGIPLEEIDCDTSFLFDHAACAGGWTGNTFHLDIHWNTTPYRDKFDFTFDGQGLMLHIQRPLPPFAVDITLYGRRD